MVMGHLGVGSEGRLELIQAVVCQVEWMPTGRRRKLRTGKQILRASFAKC